VLSQCGWRSHHSRIAHLARASFLNKCSNMGTMQNTKALGEVTEGVILAHLLRRGEVVLLPFGNNQRYDMVVDRSGLLIKAQCKTGDYDKARSAFVPTSVQLPVARDTIVGTSMCFSYGALNWTQTTKYRPNYVGR